MTKKFDLCKELQSNGFHNDGNNRLVRDNFIMEVEVAWFGKQISTLSIQVQFNSDRTVCTVYYYKDGFKSPFKVKTHMADKRAFNAIRDTAKYNGFEF